MERRKEASVWVYRYRFWDPASNEMVTASREATLDAIRNGLGVPLVESGRKVGVHAIDRQGRVKARDEEDAFDD